MSQENVEIVREANAAFNQRDLDHWIEFFDPEIEYHDTPGFPSGGMHLGREAFRRHAESYLDAWSDASVEIDARAVGKQVVGRIRYTGAVRATGIEGRDSRVRGALQLPRRAHPSRPPVRNLRRRPRSRRAAGVARLDAAPAAR
jgi:ketosteroid isomerase-like protein